jgi:hypothetical protein
VNLVLAKLYFLLTETEKREPILGPFLEETFENRDMFFDLDFFVLEDELVSEDINLQALLVIGVVLALLFVLALHSALVKEIALTMDD